MKTKTIIITLITMLAVTALIFQSCKKDEKPENQVPTCEITAPTNNQSFVKGETVTISVETNDNDGNIAEVRFAIDGVEKGSASSYPYNYNCSTNNESIGSHIIKATSIDNVGGSSFDEITIELTENSGGGGDLEWVYVSGGTFQMGSNAGGSYEQPIHTVTLSSFEITKHEVTNGQYCEFLNDIGCNSNGIHNETEYIDVSECQINYSGGQFVPESGKTDFPVIEVSWYGSDAFAQWAGGRLPTEAEWEFAARGGNNSNGYTYSGSNSVGDVAWYHTNSEFHAHQVGTKATNELETHDMSGNVWEWCNDWYDGYYYSVSPQNNPQGPSSGSSRVLRSGTWNSLSNLCRVANRYSNFPGDTRRSTGFRIAR